MIRPTADRVKESLFNILVVILGGLTDAGCWISLPEPAILAWRP